MSRKTQKRQSTIAALNEKNSQELEDINKERQAIVDQYEVGNRPNQIIKQLERRYTGLVISQSQTIKPVIADSVYQYVWGLILYRMFLAPFRFPLHSIIRYISGLVTGGGL